MNLLQRLVGAKGLTINRVAEPPEMMADGSFSDFYRSVIGGGSGDAVEQTFEQIYKTNGIVFACIAARMMPFSEVRFQYQRMVRGRPGEMWGDASLSLLENPWTNGSTGELLARMEQDASLSGNFFAVKVKDDEGRWGLIGCGCLPVFRGCRTRRTIYGRGCSGITTSRRTGTPR